MANSSLLTRHELYRQVWSEPMTSLAKKYDISDYELRKVCRTMAIPVPKLGHWQRIRAGKHVPLPSLPTEYSGEEEIDLKIVSSVSTERKLSPVELLQKEIEAELNKVLQVPSKLSNPDVLIIAVKDYIEKNNYTDYSTGLTRTHGSNLDVNVTKANLGRALRFMDTFIKVLRARGHEIKIKNYKAVFLVENDEYELAIREKLKRSDQIRPGNYSYDYTPTNILILKTGRFSNQQEWSDGKLPLEKKISAIIASIELKAKLWRQELEESWRRNDEQEAQRQIQREKELLKEKELVLFKRLLIKAKRWQDSQMLREFVEAEELQMRKTNNNTDKFDQWADWVRKKADWYDPLTNSYDVLLNEVDKDSLSFNK